MFAGAMGLGQGDGQSPDSIHALCSSCLWLINMVNAYER